MVFSPKMIERSRIMYEKFSAQTINSIRMKKPKYNFNYLCDESNTEAIENNIKARKGVGNIRNVINLYKDFIQAEKNEDNMNALNYCKKLFEEARKIPNNTHPLVATYGNEPKVVKLINEIPVFDDAKTLEFADLARYFHIMRTDQLGPMTGTRSYYFMSDLAELEEALVKYSVNNLLDKGFQLISVPDMLSPSIIENCGMTTTGERTQIYSLDPTCHKLDEACLSGTAEMSLAGLMNHTSHSEENLPIKMAAVSRCYRAEASSDVEHRGIYRVHQFTKVEMFGVCTPEMSDPLLEEFRTIQEESFADLGLHMRVLDMPPHELGAAAYRKYDIEAWMPGRKMFGEISSCSNCTDYQSRGLYIQYTPRNGSELKFAHTLNGTACAIPRMMISLLETHQQNNSTILIPEKLQKYMSGKKHISKRKLVPEIKLVKAKI